MMAEANEEEDNTELIAHFQEVTGVDSLERCRELLSAHSWDLEAAVQDALTQREGGTPVYAPPPPPPPPPPPQQAVLPRQQGWWEWLNNLALFPLRFVLHTANEVLQVLVNLVFGFQPQPAQNPRADVQQFVSSFEVQYGLQHPAFLVASYQQALSQARGELKFLLVYLHSPGHQDTPHFCRAVLCSQVFADFLSERSVLLWCVAVNTEEGVRVSFVMRENTYPFLALIVLRQGRMVVCERVEGCGDVGVLLGRLGRAVEACQSELVVERNERLRRRADQALREAQDEAFEASLAADRAKQRDREAEEERVRREQEREREREKEEARKVREFAEQRSESVGRLPIEPESGDPDTLHVILRLPSGQRLERRFSTHDSLQALYDFAYTAEELPHHFSLVTNFPRQVLRPDPAPHSLAQLGGLGRKCVLFVQNDDD